MERQQAGQQDALVQVEMDSLEASRRPRGSPADRRRCFRYKVALAAMGVVSVALLVAVLLQHLYMPTTPSCNQVSLPPDNKAQCYTTYKLKKSDEQGRYDIFTVNKTATYLIYGEVKNVTSEEVILIETRKTSRTIQKKSPSDGEIFLLDKVKLVSGTRISIVFESTYPDGSQFLVNEL